jgi:hypothetical protein
LTSRKRRFLPGAVIRCSEEEGREA